MNVERPLSNYGTIYPVSNRMYGQIGSWLCQVTFTHPLKFRTMPVWAKSPRPSYLIQKRTRRNKRAGKPRPARLYAACTIFTSSLSRACHVQVFLYPSGRVASRPSHTTAHSRGSRGMLLRMSSCGAQGTLRTVSARSLSGR
jgi:hypothetical protein